MKRFRRWAREAWLVFTRRHEVYAATQGGLALDEIRAHLLALGIDARHLSDEELTRSLLDFGRIVAGAGIPWELAAEGLRVGCAVLRSTLTWDELEGAAWSVRSERVR